jgi:uncharacterized protein (DUF1684 family)
VTSPPDLLTLADWRRRIAELYAEVRRVAVADPASAHAIWCREREALYRTHPASPVPAGGRAAFYSIHWPYSEAWRLAAPMAIPDEGSPIGAAAAISFIPSSIGGPPPLELAGHVTLKLPEGPVRLPVLHLLEYAGGIFLPFGDATNGGATYATGRYLLDTAKGADLGATADGELILDFNFAYQPSCAFDPRWACPLAPPESRLAIAIEAGERLH